MSKEFFILLSKFVLILMYPYPFGDFVACSNYYIYTKEVFQNCERYERRRQTYV